MDLEGCVNLGGILIILIILSSLVYYLGFSETTKYNQHIKDKFKDCMELVGISYCEDINKDYRSIVYGSFSIDQNKSFLKKPLQIICRDKRECCSIERYYVLDLEIESCIDKSFAKSVGDGK